MVFMATHNSGNPSTHLGRQMKRDREAYGWTLRDLSARTGVDFSDLSKVENGKRPMTRALAEKCDEQFTERRGWYVTYWDESRDWMPAGFRDWREYESRARELIIWVPGIVDGTAQTEPYARAVLSVHPGVAPDVIETRLRNRLERQRWVLREGGPTVVLLVDHVALYRAYGDAETMAGQMGRLLDVAALDSVTVQVVPSVGHPLATASAIVTDTAAYTEHGLGGSVFTEDESVTRLRRLIGTVRGEARPVRESLVMIREADKRWNGVSRRTAATAAKRASK
jgi:transcriptional regulator with XRE-family HTH domain